MCVFCKFVNGDIPSAKIYEDEDVLAILDLSQVTYGHTLVMPKKHVSDLIECDQETYLKVMTVVQKLSKQITEKCNANGCNILSNIKEAAGQTVMHMHVHIIPRYDASDALEINFNPSKKVELSEVQKTILN